MAAGHGGQFDQIFFTNCGQESSLAPDRCNLKGKLGIGMHLNPDEEILGVTRQTKIYGEGHFSDKGETGSKGLMSTLTAAGFRKGASGQAIAGPSEYDKPNTLIGVGYVLPDAKIARLTRWANITGEGDGRSSLNPSGGMPLNPIGSNQEGGEDGHDQDNGEAWIHTATSARADMGAEDFDKATFFLVALTPDANITGAPMFLSTERGRWLYMDYGHPTLKQSDERQLPAIFQAVKDMCITGEKHMTTAQGDTLMTQFTRRAAHRVCADDGVLCLVHTEKDGLRSWNAQLRTLLGDMMALFRIGGGKNKLRMLIAGPTWNNSWKELVLLEQATMAYWGERDGASLTEIRIKATVLRAERPGESASNLWIPHFTDYDHFKGPLSLEAVLYHGSCSMEGTQAHQAIEDISEVGSLITAKGKDGEATKIMKTSCASACIDNFIEGLKTATGTAPNDPLPDVIELDPEDAELLVRFERLLYMLRVLKKGNPGKALSPEDCTHLHLALIRGLFPPPKGSHRPGLRENLSAQDRGAQGLSSDFGYAGDEHDDAGTDSGKVNQRLRGWLGNLKTTRVTPMSAKAIQVAELVNLIGFAATTLRKLKGLSEEGHLRGAIEEVVRRLPLPDTGTICGDNHYVTSPLSRCMDEEAAIEQIASIARATAGQEKGAAAEAVLLLEILMAQCATIKSRHADGEGDGPAALRASIFNAGIYEEPCSTVHLLQGIKACLEASLQTGCEPLVAPWAGEGLEPARAKIIQLLAQGGDLGHLSGNDSKEVFRNGMNQDNYAEVTEQILADTGVYRVRRLANIASGALGMMATATHARLQAGPSPNSECGKCRGATRYDPQYCSQCFNDIKIIYRLACHWKSQWLYADPNETLANIHGSQHSGDKTLFRSKEGASLGNMYNDCLLEETILTRGAMVSQAVTQPRGAKIDPAMIVKACLLEGDLNMALEGTTAWTQARLKQAVTLAKGKECKVAHLLLAICQKVDGFPGDIRSWNKGKVALNSYEGRVLQAELMIQHEAAKGRRYE